MLNPSRLGVYTLGLAFLAILNLNKNCDRLLAYWNLFIIVGGRLFPVLCPQKFDFNILTVEVDIICVLITALYDDVTFCVQCMGGQL